MNGKISFLVLALAVGALAQSGSQNETCVCDRAASCQQCDGVFQTCMGNNGTLCQCMNEGEKCLSDNKCFPFEMLCESIKASNNCSELTCYRATEEQLASPCYSCNKKIDRMIVDFEQLQNGNGNTTEVCLDMELSYGCERDHGCWTDARANEQCLNFSTMLGCTNDPCRENKTVTPVRVPTPVANGTCGCPYPKVCEACQMQAEECRMSNKTECECAEVFEKCAAESNCFPYEMTCETMKMYHQCPKLECFRATEEHLASPCYECYHKMDRLATDMQQLKWGNGNATEVCMDLKVTLQCEHKYGCFGDSNSTALCAGFAAQMGCPADVCY